MTDPQDLTSLERIKYDKLVKWIEEHELCISKRLVIGPFTGKQVHAHPNDFDYSVRMWKIIAEKIKEQFGIEREMPEWAPLPEEEKVKPQKKRTYRLS